jgi:DNA-binding NtrC family response regulator
MKPKVLLVEDDQCFVDAVKMAVKELGFKMVHANSVSQAIQCFKQQNGEFDCVVIDYHLPDGKGSELAEVFYSLNPRSEILFATGDNSSAALVDMLDKGSASFILKGTTSVIDKIRLAVDAFRKDRMLLSPVTEESDFTKIEADLKSIGIVSRSIKLHEAYGKILKVREVTSDVLVCGETGVGKELIAKAFCKDNKAPFIALNAGKYATNDQFLERDLFGCVKGAYTGATTDIRGFFEQASGGIIFLDEIHRLTLNAQGLLLRVLQERKFRRMGDTSAKEINLNCRIIFGAHDDIYKRAMDGNFMLDLFFRIDKNRITVPPLRERPEDIEPLVRHFTEIYTKKHNKKVYLKSCSLELLKSLEWAGNVRNLETMIDDLITLADDEIIYSSTVKKYLEDKKIILKSVGSSSVGDAPIDFKLLNDAFWQNHIIAALNGSKTKTEAANKLNMNRTTLLSRCEKLGINPDHFMQKDVGVN